MSPLTTDQLRRKMTEIRSNEAKRIKSNALTAETMGDLLRSIAKVNPDTIPEAIKALQEAAYDYKKSNPLVDTKDRHSKPGIAEARTSVAALHKCLSATQTQLSNLPLNAFTKLTEAYDAPMGQLKADLEKVCKATEAALESLKAEPDKTPDADRNVLAYHVAVVFRDILNVKPASTSDKQLTQNMSTARSGAAYARVLRATLKAAGVVNYDPGPLIEAGLRLLKDPSPP